VITRTICNANCGIISIRRWRTDSGTSAVGSFHSQAISVVSRGMQADEIGRDPPSTITIPDRSATRSRPITPER